MHSSTDRRQFVKSLAGGATAGLLPTFAPLRVQAAAQGDFLMTDGLTYLNTGTIGPSRRATVDATQRAWEMLEANPTAHYGQRVGAPMLEDTRTVAAKFLGCDLDEMAVTGSTTAGMNAIAQGLRLGAGDRVLLTDQEHSGGLHCWQYLARHHGVELDRVAIRQGEHRAAALVDAIANGIRPRTRDDYGVIEGTQRLLTFQRRGPDSGRGTIGWRLLDVVKIESCVLTDRSFAGSRGQSHQQHYQWETLHARVT